MDTPADPFKILGIEPDAPKETVKRAYYRLAQQHHPDKGGNPTTFKRLAAAYDAIMQSGKGSRALVTKEEKQPQERRDIPSDVFDNTKTDTIYVTDDKLRRWFGGVSESARDMVIKERGFWEFLGLLGASVSAQDVWQIPGLALKVFFGTFSLIPLYQWARVVWFKTTEPMSAESIIASAKNNGSPRRRSR